MNNRVRGFEMSCKDDIGITLEELKMNYVKVVKKIEETGLDMIRGNDILTKESKLYEERSMNTNHEIYETNYVNLLKVLEGMMTEFEGIDKRVDINERKEYTFSDGRKRKISNELVTKYPESLLNVNMIDIDSRNNRNEIEIDFRLKYMNEIVNYMNDEYDIDELSGIEFDVFCRELMEMRIPFRSDIMNRLYTNSSEYGVGWKNRCIMVDGKELPFLQQQLRWNHLMLPLKCIHYTEKKERLEFTINAKGDKAILLNDFERYLKDPSKYTKMYELNIDAIVNCFTDLELDLSSDLIRQYLLNYTNSLFLYGTEVLENTDYDECLRKWTGYDRKWKLIYRASNNQFKKHSFTDACYSAQGPTIVIVRNKEGWIFGCYATELYKEKIGYGCIVKGMILSLSCYSLDIQMNDPNLFTFTLKNPFFDTPTRYLKKNGRIPFFTDYEMDGCGFNDQLYICNECFYKDDSYFIMNGDEYETDPPLPPSTFVNCYEPIKYNFYIQDYEVYALDSDNKHTLYSLSKYPDIIWKMKTLNTIPATLIQHVRNEQDLVNDLLNSFFTEGKYLTAISQYYLKHPSEFLPNTHIVDKQYDSILREWIGDHKMKLIYRASEHEYINQSCYDYCHNYCKPLLLVIKSSEGWVFGCYSTSKLFKNGIDFLFPYYFLKIRTNMIQTLTCSH